MADDERQESTEESVREREDEARRARTGAEAERASGERESEIAEDAGDAVVPADDEELREGVVPPPPTPGME